MIVISAYKGSQLFAVEEFYAQKHFERAQAIVFQKLPAFDTYSKLLLQKIVEALHGPHGLIVRRKHSVWPGKIRFKH